MGRQVCALMEVCGFQVSVWARELTENHRKRYKFERKLCFKNFQIPDREQGVEFLSDVNTLSPGVTIELLPEDLQIKRQVLEKLSFEPTELLTNTSSFLPVEVHPKAEALHFFNPISMIKIVETSLKPDQRSESVSILTGALEKLGYQIVPIFGNRGYVGNFILFHEICAALKLVDKFKYSTETIDSVTQGMGRQSSLIDVIDFIGVDVVLKISENLREADDSFWVSPLLKKAVELGILGRKNKTSFREFVDSVSSDARYREV